MQSAKSNAKGAAYALLAMAIYASHDAIVKTLGERYSAIQIVFFAALLSFPLISMICCRTNARAICGRSIPGG